MQPQHAVNLKNMKPEKGTATEASGAINLAPLRESLKELERAAQIVKDHQAAYGDLLHTVAEKTGLAASVIRSFLAARIADTDKARDRKKERAAQLALVFDEVDG